MRSREEDAVDSIDWEEWVPTRAPASRRDNRWSWAILAIVVFAHALGALLVASGGTEQASAVEYEDALLIDFVVRAPVQTSVMQISRPSIQDTSSQGPRHTTSPNQVGTVSLAHPRAAMDDAPLRLHLEADSWNPKPLALAANALAAKIDPVLEHARPLMPGVKLGQGPSPKQALAMLGALFGSPPYDPCPQISGRLANMPSAMNELDLASDLQIRERRCRR